MEKQVFINEEPTYYYITEEGRLYNQKTDNWYKGNIAGGYLKYDLRWKDKKYSKLAHRLVAEAFILNPNNLPVVNHKDGNKLNNNINNLEWVTVAENNIHAYETGLKQKTNGLNQRIKIEDYKEAKDECWKQFENTTYYISNKGKIKNIETGNVLKGKVTKDGYIEWCLSIDGKKHSYLAHRLVYKTFLGKLEKGLVINHKNGNKQDNSIDNLEQVTNSANIIHSYYEISHSNIRTVGKFDLNGGTCNEKTGIKLL